MLLIYEAVSCRYLKITENKQISSSWLPDSVTQRRDSLLVDISAPLLLYYRLPLCLNVKKRSRNKADPFMSVDLTTNEKPR